MLLGTLKKFFRIDESSPSFLVWNDPLPFLYYEDMRSWKRAMTLFAGKPAGSIRKCGKKIGGSRKYKYWCTKILETSLPCHRAVYMLYHDVQLTDDVDIDHEDGDTMNNAPWNLRIATRSQNCMNAPGKCTSKTGLKGVSVRQRGGSITYESVIMKDGKAKFLGTFSTAKAAHDAYRLASASMHGEFSRTK